MKRNILINADDFGWTDGHNLAIAQAYKKGGLNRVSLLSNAPGFSQAVDLAHQLPGLQIGVHLALNELPPILHTPEVLSLTDIDGNFEESVSSIIKRWLKRSLPIESIREEWDRQIEKVAHAGITINHLDAHKHVHIIPSLSEIFVDLAKKYQVSMIRVPIDKLSLLAVNRRAQGVIFWMLARRFQRLAEGSGLHFPDRFIGVYDSGHITRPKLVKLIKSVKEGTAEIMMHPAIVSEQVVVLQNRYKWAAVYQFEEEYNALCDKAVISLLH